MLPIILGGIAVVGIIFLLYVASKPSAFRVSRSALMSAPASAIYAQVNDFHKWEAWSPWAKKDPAAKNSFEGPAAGTGAVFRWDGNRNVGAGGMTIIESRPNELIRIQLEFLKPFRGSNEVEFTFHPQGGQTLVTWTMTGKSSFIPKIFCTFINMDKMIGTEYEKGLAAIKAAVESPARS